MKLLAHTAGLPGHASGEQNVSKGSFVHIVPLPAWQDGDVSATSHESPE